MKFLIYFENVYLLLARLISVYFPVKICGNVPVLDGKNVSASSLLLTVIPHVKEFSS